MTGLSVTDITFEPRSLPEYKFELKKILPHNISATVVFEPSVKWRLVDEYGIDSFTYTEDGRLLFKFGFTDKENLLGWLLSFGDKAELLEPSELRLELKELMESISRKYY